MPQVSRRTVSEVGGRVRVSGRVPHERYQSARLDCGRYVAARPADGGVERTRAGHHPDRRQGLPRVRPRSQQPQRDVHAGATGLRHHCTTRYEHCTAGQVLCRSISSSTLSARLRREGSCALKWSPVPTRVHWTRRNHTGSHAGSHRLGRHCLSGMAVTPAKPGTWRTSRAVPGSEPDLWPLDNARRSRGSRRRGADAANGKTGPPASFSSSLLRAVAASPISTHQAPAS